MSKKQKDRVEILEERIRKLESVLREKEKTINQLKGRVGSAQSAFKTTEVYLKEVTNGKPLSEILKIVESGKPLTDINSECPKCHSHDMKKMVFNGFHIITCECGYRNKVDEEQQIGKIERIEGKDVRSGDES